MAPWATADLGAPQSRTVWMRVNMWTQRSLQTPPEYSHQQRQRKKCLASNGRWGARPRNLSQAMVAGEASGGMAYTQAAPGVFRWLDMRAMLMVPSAPDLTISWALRLMGVVRCWQIGRAHV